MSGSAALPTPSAVLWDMDGTLIDQTAGIIRCYREVVTALGHPAPDEGLIRRSLGGPMGETMALFVPREQMDAAARAFRERFPRIMFDGLVVHAGALELIREFGDRGIPQAIFTNKHGPTAREVSRHCGFSQTIHVCIGNTDTEWSKPDPELTRHVIDSLGVGREGTVLIGDSPTDVETAGAAGLACYAVATGAHGREELLAAGASAAFDSLTELRRAFS